MTKFIIFIIIFALAFVWYFVSGLIRRRKLIRQNNITRAGQELLKETGIKIVVYFKDCAIRTNEYFPDLQPNETSNSEQRTVSVIICIQKDTTGKIREYISDSIEMPIESLRLRLESKKYTSLYVNKKDNDQYYFDLDFIRTT
ncbi:hypothetical protein [Paraflavitalea sp. CAU 1676]|uniref:hypothetical protein n=1 Tax=Paraflavitalea sp. CAU 1676 TaxID=3032598 RepID=UPI0023DBF6C2|nr:hypothetical protein [Paraflavitalea sp. CAU 1676]MDF2193460.1 hypothetical protein [Paraflavitalea sp. CAU 1676]